MHDNAYTIKIITAKNAYSIKMITKKKTTYNRSSFFLKIGRAHV